MNNNKTEDKNDVKDSNVNLSSIILSEGTIDDFDPNVLDYYIEVSDFDKLEVIPSSESSNAQTSFCRRHRLM